MDIDMSTALGAGAVASKLETATRPLEAHATGRRCAHPRCETTLSRYNPDDHCNAHGGWSDRSVKRPGRKPREHQRDAA